MNKTTQMYVTRKCFPVSYITIGSASHLHKVELHATFLCHLPRPFCVISGRLA